MGKRVIMVCMMVLVGMLFSPRAGFAQHTDKSNPPPSDSKRQGDTSSKQTNTSNRQGQTSRTDATGANSGQALKSDDRKFVMEAAHSGMAEVELGRLAVERAASDEVKQFGQRMIDDHSRANSELMELASRKGVTLSMNMGAQGSGSSTMSTTATTSGTGTGTSTTGTSGSSTSGSSSAGMAQGTGSSASGHAHSGDEAKMMQKHQEMKTRLSGLSGAEFDREYMRQMVKDHDAAVSMFQREASRGSDAELKAWAAKTLPALQEHLRMAREISGRTGGSGNSATSKPNSGNN